MNNKTFLIKFHDANVHPNNIRARDLAAVLHQLDGSISAIVESLNPGMFAGGLGVSLVNIKEGCAALEFDYGNQAVNEPAFRLLTQSIRDNAPSRMPAKARGIIKVVSDFNVKYKCRTEFWSSPESGHPDAIIPRPEVLAVPESGAIKGVTDLYGEVVRVGGQRKPGIELKMDSGLTLDIKTTKEMAISLGRRMYEIVGLHGEAVWDLATGNIVSFYAEKILPYEDTPIDIAFEKTRTEFGDCFNDIDDVNTFVSRLRED